MLRIAVKTAVSNGREIRNQSLTYFTRYLMGVYRRHASTFVGGAVVKSRKGSHLEGGSHEQRPHNGGYDGRLLSTCIAHDVWFPREAIVPR
jgi:hypothetical protein